MDHDRVRSIVGKIMILAGALLFLTMGFWSDLVVDHQQIYELDSWDTFYAGVGPLNDSFPSWLMPPLKWDVGEAHLDTGAHALWVERLDGTETMWDVVDLHIEDNGHWVVYHRPTVSRTMERDGIEYELMFTFDVVSAGNHTIESMGSSNDMSGEEVHIMITHYKDVNPFLLLPGLIILLCGIVIIVYTVIRRRKDAVPNEEIPFLQDFSSRPKG